MPTIPRFTKVSQRSLSVPKVNLSQEGVGSVGKELQNIGADAKSFLDDLVVKRKRFNDSKDVTLNSLEFQRSWRKREAELKQERGTSGYMPAEYNGKDGKLRTYGEVVDEEITQLYEDTAKESRNSDSEEIFRAKLGALKNDAILSAESESRKLNIASTRKAYFDATETDQRDILMDEDLDEQRVINAYSTVLDGVNELNVNGAISDATESADRKKIKNSWGNGTIKNYMMYGKYKKAIAFALAGTDQKGIEKAMEMDPEILENLGGFSKDDVAAMNVSKKEAYKTIASFSGNPIHDLSHSLTTEQTQKYIKEAQKHLDRKIAKDYKFWKSEMKGWAGMAQRGDLNTLADRKGAQEALELSTVKNLKGDDRMIALRLAEIRAGSYENDIYNLLPTVAPDKRERYIKSLPIKTKSIVDGIIGDYPELSKHRKTLMNSPAIMGVTSRFIKNIGNRSNHLAAEMREKGLSSYLEKHDGGTIEGYKRRGDYEGLREYKESVANKLKVPYSSRDNVSKLDIDELVAEWNDSSPTEQEELLTNMQKKYGKEWDVYSSEYMGKNKLPLGLRVASSLVDRKARGDVLMTLSSKNNRSVKKQMETEQSANMVKLYQTVRDDKVMMAWRRAIRYSSANPAEAASMIEAMNEGVSILSMHEALRTDRSVGYIGRAKNLVTGWFDDEVDDMVEASVKRVIGGTYDIVEPNGVALLVPKTAGIPPHYVNAYVEANDSAQNLGALRPAMSKIWEESVKFKKSVNKQAWENFIQKPLAFETLDKKFHSSLVIKPEPKREISAREHWHEYLEDNHFWVSSRNGFRGITLMVNLPDGSRAPVTSVKGGVITSTWDEIRGSKEVADYLSPIMGGR